MYVCKMASVHTFTTPNKKAEVVKRFKELAKREGGISKILTEYMEQYVKEHEATNNPQAKLTLFQQDHIVACPNLYTAGTVKGEEKIDKFMNTLNSKDYKQLDEMVQRWNWLLSQQNRRRRL